MDLQTADGAMCRSSWALGFAVLTGVYGTNSSFQVCKSKSLNSFDNS